MKDTLPELWHACWIEPAAGLERLPILFREFRCETLPERAVLFVSGLGLFEAVLNGEKLGDEVLTPFFDDYNAGTQTLTFDVTQKLQHENRLEIRVGNGWYRGRFGMIPRSERYGSVLCAVAQLEMTDADGRRSFVVTDEHWRCMASSIVSGGIYDGERQDWLNLCPQIVPVRRSERSISTLMPRVSAPLRITQRLPVRRVLHTPNGETVLDFGQNFAGWVEIACEQPAGAEIRLEFGEILVDGCFYNENYRTAVGGFSFVCDGTRRVYHPRFTYFGFRYVRVTGWAGELTGEEFSGCVIHSDLPRTGWFRCGHGGLERLYENILWSQRSNFVDVPTDCPQRDERLPWSGDAQIFAATACFNMDCREFYPHFLKLLRQDQLAHDGAVANYLPRDMVLSDACAIWGDAAIELPITLYEYYGDKKILEDNLPMMIDWVEYLKRQNQINGGNWLCNYGFQFGDWLALDGISENSFKGATEDTLVASFCWYHAVEQMARVCTILGKKEEQVQYESMAASIREAVLHEYFTPSGRLAVDTQTAYLLSLRFGLYPDRQRVTEGLRHRLEKDCWHITSGFAAAPLVCSVLADHGMEDAALRLLLDQGYPGWLYEVERGATTIWERWNSLLPDGRVNPSGMNSFNHYSYGSVGRFLYERVAGLQGISPGFRSVRFAPCVDGRIGRCEAAYDSVSGRWECAWRILGNGSVSVSLLVPEGCTAEVALPFTEQGSFSLDAGLFEHTYRPNRELRAKYSADTLLRELKEDREAMELVGEMVPELAGVIASGDRELGAMRLGQLSGLPQLGVGSGSIGRLIGALSALRYDL